MPNDDYNISHKPQVSMSLAGMVDLAPMWVTLDPKLDKSGTFSDQISVHLARLDAKLDKSRTFSDQISVHLAR